jgi:hypothetical protein
MLETKGLRVTRQPACQKFRIGNDETRAARERAILPVGLGGVSGYIKPYVIPGWTPLLVSKPFLKAMQGIIDLERDVVVLKKIGVEVPIIDPNNRHPTISLIDFGPAGFRVPADGLEEMLAQEASVYKVAAAFVRPASDAGGNDNLATQPHEPEMPEDSSEETERHWIRRHLVARRSLFDPRSSRDGPQTNTIGKTRITKGRYLGGGEFEVEDAWNKSPNMESLWLGETWFRKAGETEQRAMTMERETSTKPMRGQRAKSTLAGQRRCHAYHKRI